MPKRRAARRAGVRSRRRALTCQVLPVALALRLTASGLTWAVWGRPARYKAGPFDAGPPAAPAHAPPSPDGFAPASPSKEYVYAAHFEQLREPVR